MSKETSKVGAHTVGVLLDFIASRGDIAFARDTAEGLQAAGQPLPMSFGAPARSPPKPARITKALGKKPQTPAAATNDARRRTLLLKAGFKTLGAVVDEFAALIPATQKRLTLAGRLRLGSSILTALLSSAVVATIHNQPEPALWLGVATLASSVLMIVAGYLDGGKLTQSYIDVSGKYAQAVALKDRMETYLKDPVLFDDVDTLLNEAAALVQKLKELKLRLQGLN